MRKVYLKKNLRRKYSKNIQTIQTIFKLYQRGTKNVKVKKNRQGTNQFFTYGEFKGTSK